MRAGVLRPGVRVVALLLLCAVRFAASDPPEKLRMGVCVTGQLKRMEFWSKLQNLIVPNMHSHDITLLFVLDPEGNRAVNDRASNLGLPATILNESDILMNVQRYCPTCAVEVDFYAQPSQPAVVHNYVVDLDKGPRNFTTRKASRAMVHARLFHSWSRCWVGFRRQPNNKFDVFVRARDDLLFPFPLRITPPMWEGAVSTSEVCNCGGLNDKAGILDAKYAQEYFGNPVLNMLLYYDEIRATQERIRNSETTLQASLHVDNVPIRLLNTTQFPFIVTRRKKDSSFCLADQPAKLGPNMRCIPEAALEFFQTYRCRRNLGLPDGDGWWAGKTKNVTTFIS